MHTGQVGLCVYDIRLCGRAFVVELLGAWQREDHLVGIALCRIGQEEVGIVVVQLVRTFVDDFLTSSRSTGVIAHVEGMACLEAECGPLRSPSLVTAGGGQQAGRRLKIVVDVAVDLRNGRASIGKGSVDGKKTVDIRHVPELLGKPTIGGSSEEPSLSNVACHRGIRQTVGLSLVRIEDDSVGATHHLVLCVPQIRHFIGLSAECPVDDSAGHVAVGVVVGPTLLIGGPEAVAVQVS